MLFCKSIPGLKCIHSKKICYTFYMSLVKVLKKWLNPNFSLLSCFRGTSKSQSAVAFRRWFYKLSELRSLVNKEVPFMAVTATATQIQRKVRALTYDLVLFITSDIIGSLLQREI